MVSNARRLKLARIYDDSLDRVPDHEAVEFARSHPAIPDDAVPEQGPVRTVTRASVDVLFSHPTFEPVPDDEALPVVEMLWDRAA